MSVVIFIIDPRFCLFASASIIFLLLSAVRKSRSGAGTQGQDLLMPTPIAPNIDGILIPDKHGKLLTNKRVDNKVQRIIAHNLNEGLMFTDPRIQDQSGFISYLQGVLPRASSATISYIANTIYPEDYSGAQPYTNPTQRASLAIGEIIVSCYAYGLNLASNRGSRGSQFSIFPGMHSQDSSFTFWNGDATDSWGLPVPPATSRTMQGWFVDFAISGTGRDSTAANLPLYSSLAKVMKISLENGFQVVNDPAANSRCDFFANRLRNRGALFIIEHTFFLSSTIYVYLLERQKLFYVGINSYPPLFAVPFC